MNAARKIQTFQTLAIARFPVRCRAFATFPQVNPRTGKVFNEYTQLTDAELEAALQNSHGAFKEWRAVPVAERAAALAKLADGLRGKADDFASLINQEMGKPEPQCKAEVLKCAGLVDYYVEHGPTFMQDVEYPALPGMKRSFVTFQPLGTILSIMPWNFPFWQVIRMAVPTLMAGNVVVLKHAPNCFGTGAAAESLFRELPGLPSHLFQSLVIDVPQVTHVLEHDTVRGVALTGSEAAGRAVAAKAGGLLKKAVIELGGSDGYAILKDADLDQAAAAVVDARIMNAGQVCIAPKRAIVEKSVRPAFEEKVLAKIAEKTYGVDFGPLVHVQAKREVARQVDESIAQGAKLLHGGTGLSPPEGDSEAYFAPTVLSDVTPGMTAFDKEIFGPVVSIIEAESDEHAVELANQSAFGLGGSVFTKDLEKGEKLAVSGMDVGMCFVNDFVRSDPSLPFGGTKNSGLGRECGVAGMMEFVNVKTICIKA